MIRKIAFLLIFSAIAVTGFAFDKSDFNSALEDLSKGIAQTAYVLSENSESNERQAYETVANQTDRKETRLKNLISKIENPEDFATAQLPMLSNYWHKERNLLIQAKPAQITKLPLNAILKWQPHRKF
jgi:ABC-type transporter Mla subunit MlaD